MDFNRRLRSATPHVKVPISQYPDQRDYLDVTDHTVWLEDQAHRASFVKMAAENSSNNIVPFDLRELKATSGPTSLS